jgi:NADPH:quinone reductase-like Zn-dependent oxidoreductase
VSAAHREVAVLRPGGHDRLVVVERPARPLGERDVRIAVAACGVNYADCCVRMGLYAAVEEYPVTPGFEVAGRVVECGSAVEDLAPGDEVLAVTRFGGYATELVVARELAFRRPPGLSVEQAAAFPAVHLTAWHALADLAHVREGETVLVHSAAGGVGTAACGIASRLGARVVGVVGAPHKVEVARRHGAATVVDKSSEDLWEAVERAAPSGCDVVLDANGVETLRGSYEHLAVAGRLLVYGFATMLPRGRQRPSRPALLWHWLRTPRFDPLRMTSENRAVIGFNVVHQFDRVEHFRAALKRLLGWCEQGALRPPEVTAVPFERAAEAHALLESGESTGKVVLVVD